MLKSRAHKGLKVLVLGLVFGMTVSLMPAREATVSTFPGGQTVRAFAMHGEGRYYGTRDGLWRRADWHEEDEVERIWGQPRQAVTGLAVRENRMVVAAGNLLLTGPADEPTQWRELPRAAFVPEPANDWQHLRVLFNRFVVRGSKGYYTSTDGEHWERLAPENKIVRAVGGDYQHLWVVVSEPDRPGYVFGRSEDLRTWTWSEPLPEHFKPLSPVFPVIAEGVAVLAGSYAANGETLNVPQALLAYRWPHDGPVEWRIATHAMPPGGSLMEVAQMGADAWARLPNGDLAASVNGFHWVRVAQNPLGTANAWFLGDNPHNEFLLLATNDGRYLQLFPDELEYAGRGGAPEIAWSTVQGSVPPPAEDAPVSVASIAQGMLDAQKTNAKAVNDLLAQHPAAGAPAAGSAAVAEQKKHEAPPKTAAEEPPPTVAGAVEMAKTFHHFERLYVSGASRKDLAQQVVGVHEAVRKHRPRLADEVAEVLSILVVNLEVRDALTTAFLAHHLPGFRKKVQTRYGKAYSQIYWSLKRASGAQPVNEYEVDVMKELLMSHTDNSYLRRVTFPKIPQGYPNYDADKPRKPVEFVAQPDVPFDPAEMLKNLVEKGWAGAALDRDAMHANKLQIEADTAMRHVWLLAARVLWPGTPPASSDDLLKRSNEEKARLGSLFAADALAFDARKAGRTEDFARYRDLAVQRGMQASRYVSYTEQMAAALSVMNEADRNTAAAMGDYAKQISAATGTDAPSPRAGASSRPTFEILTASESAIRDLEWQNAQARPEGPARQRALEEHRSKWEEKLRFRQLAKKLFEAAALADTEENGMARAAVLLGISRTDAALFGQTPQHLDNRLLLPSLLSVAQNRIPREQHAEVLDRILRDVPTLADVWVLRVGYHIEAGEWDLAEGALAVARLLNPKEPNLEKMENRLDAQRPALTNEDIIRRRFARTWEEAEASVDDELRSRDPAADYAMGLEFEQGTKGRDVKERIDKAQFHYLKAALADHVPSMLGYVRVANANLQQPGVSDATRAAIEKDIVKWVNKAADLGNGEALRVRAGWRANGQAGLTADRGLAWLELERAAEAGDWPAMRMLAQAAHAGEWGRQDFKTVENWLERARAAGDPEAGRMLEELRKQQQGGKK